MQLSSYESQVRARVLSNSIYVGRLLLLGYSKRGDPAAVYRLASRSFPHRRIAIAGNLASVRPKPGFEYEAVSRNLTPYYCLGLVGDKGILVANGRHFPPIFSQISLGKVPRRSISQVLGFYGPEEDEFLTPRICGFISESGVVVGIVSEDGVRIREYSPRSGEAVYVSTYVRTNPDENLIGDFDFSSIHDLTRYVHDGSIFRRFSKKICTVTGTIADGRFALAALP